MADSKRRVPRRREGRCLAQRVDAFRIRPPTHYIKAARVRTRGGVSHEGGRVPEPLRMKDANGPAGVALRGVRRGGLNQDRVTTLHILQGDEVRGRKTRGTRLGRGINGIKVKVG